MKEIKARNGYFLTQKANVSDEERIYITAIKGVNVDESEWIEVTEYEKNIYDITVNDN